MRNFSTQEIRNVVLLGHKGSGKTTLAEAMLFASKATTRQGRVEDGNTVFDFEPEEHKRVGSVSSAVGHVEWQKHKINILDTPGDLTFAADTHNCLAVSDAVVMVVSAPDGFDLPDAKLFKSALGRSRCVVINKMGRERADFAAALAQVKERLTHAAAVLTLPMGAEEGFKGVVDVLEMQAYLFAPATAEAPKPQEVPPELQELASTMREALIEEIAATDEQLMEKYLDAGQLALEEARAGLRRAVASGALCPVFATDAATCVGVQPLLNALVQLCATPDQGVRIPLRSLEPESEEKLAPADGEFVGLVFKTFIDQHSGKISIFRVLGGKARKDMMVRNVNHNTAERFGALYSLQGKKVEALEEAAVGDIVAVAKLKDTLTGDTLTAGTGGERARLPAPLPPQITFRIIPKNKGDEDKISQAVHRLLEEDPSLVVGHDEMTKELTLSGYGTAHIDVALEKMVRKFHVEVSKAPPLVAYRETIMRPVKNVEGKHKKQSGGRGQFGVCYINVAPLRRGEGYRFVDSVFGGAIPRQYIPAVDKGIQEALGRGVLAGYPVVDVEVDLVDGKYHDVDSSEMAFKIAGSKAIQVAAKSAGVTLLEPIMAVEIEVPEDSLGDVMGDINGRRGRVLGMDTVEGVARIKAQAPLAEMISYAPDLKAMTAGRGLFTMSFVQYDTVPAHLVDKVVAESPHKPGTHEED